MGEEGLVVAYIFDISYPNRRSCLLLRKSHWFRIINNVPILACMSWVAGPETPIVAFVSLKFSSVDIFLNGHRMPTGDKNKDWLWDISNIATQETHSHSFFTWPSLYHALHGLLNVCVLDSLNQIPSEGWQLRAVAFIFCSFLLVTFYRGVWKCMQRFIS